MSRTYKATGINIKGMPLGEADRLVTILTPEFGLVRAVAPGARKHKSKLRGRSELFVVNQLLIAKGRSLDKITQAETIESYPSLSKDLGKLAASQYLAELVLLVALSEHPQQEIYELFNEHLRRLAQLPNQTNHTSSITIFAHLAQAVFHLLAIAGIAPQVHACCLTQQSLRANFSDPLWRVGFSFDAGGLVNLSAKGLKPIMSKQVKLEEKDINQQSQTRVNRKLTAVELTLLQQLGAKSLPRASDILPQELISSSVDVAWMKIERLLRDYTQYHFSRDLRSAALVDALSPLEF